MHLLDRTETPKQSLRYPSSYTVETRVLEELQAVLTKILLAHTADLRASAHTSNQVTIRPILCECRGEEFS